MEFTLQLPGTEKLLEAVDSAALGANSGGGVFAFASRGGIDAFFARANLSNMLSKGRAFHIIVGIDAVTNVEALLCLSDKVKLFKGALKASIFYHENPGIIFHPKFTWFIQGETIKVLTGSGNLTLGGLGQIPIDGKLLGNWEAFSVQIFKKNFVTVKKQIEDWLKEQQAKGRLRNLDDEEVRQMAMGNARARFVRVTTEGKKVAKGAPIDSLEFTTPEVLIRELSSNRLGQADVGRDALKEFFGYIEGKSIPIFIQYVSIANKLGQVIQDHLFVNASRNYRLELRAISELGYQKGTDDSRMILVATKLDNRSFRYTIIPANTAEHAKVSTLLTTLPKVPRKGRRMREVRVTPDQLLTAWPEAPNNLLPSKSITPEI